MEQIEEQLQQLIALEAQIQQIGSLRQKVESEGMSKAIAMEAREMIPGFNDNTPLAFYSPTPSYAYQVAALENMSEALGAMIAAAVIALAVLIAACVDYFFGKKKSDGGSGGGGGSFFKFEYKYNGRTYSSFTEANKARDEDLNKFYENTRKEEAKHQREQAKTTNEPKTHDPLPELDQLIEKEIKEKGENSPIGRILLAEDAFTVDLLQDGKYSKELVNSLRIVPGLRKGMTALMGEIATITRDYPYVMENPNLPDAEWTEIYERLSPTGVEAGKFRDTDWSIDKLVEAIQTAKGNMHVSRLNHRFKYSELVHKVQAVVDKLPVAKMLEAFEECEKDLPDVEAKLRKLGEGMDKYKAHTDLSQLQKDYQEEAGKMVKTIRMDMTGLMKFLQELERFGRHMRTLENRMFKMQVEIVHLVSKHVAERNGKLSPEMKQLKEDMLANLTIDI